MFLEIPLLGWDGVVFTFGRVYGSSLPSLFSVLFGYQQFDSLSFSITAEAEHTVSSFMVLFLGSNVFHFLKTRVQNTVSLNSFWQN